MKKVLFATTALVGLAGAAAAEVSISGSAEMGIIGGGAAATNDSQGETQFYQSVDITFSMSAESDSGLSFGATVDLDEATELDGDLDTFSKLDDNGTSVFISGAFGTLTMGDTDGAIDWAITDAGNIGNPGSIADEETSHAGYNGSFGDGAFDNQVLRYNYSFGDFGVAVSYEQGAVGTPFGGVVIPGAPDGSLAIGLKYTLDLGGTTVNLGGGYMNSDFGTDERDIVAVGATASFAGGFTAGFTYQDWDYSTNVVRDDVKHTAIGIGYETGPISLHANWGQFDNDTLPDVEGYGFAAAYDLGGGLSVHVGYGDSDVADAESWSLGVAMSF